MIKRLTITVLSALCVLGLFAPSAMAADFYFPTTKCYVGNGLYAQASAYDINSGRDVQVHHAQKSNGIDGYYRYRIIYDGYVWPGVGPDDIGHSGSIADGYQNFGSSTANHVLTFQWKRSSGAVTGCTVNIVVPG